MWGVGIAHWLEHQTCDQKVLGSRSGWSGGIIFLLQSQLFMLTPILVCIPSPCCRVACKHSRSRSLFY